jgi:hypothetical protein
MTCLFTQSYWWCSINKMNGINNQLFYSANILGGASHRPSLQNVPNRQAPRSFPTMLPMHIGLGVTLVDKCSNKFFVLFLCMLYGCSLASTYPFKTSYPFAPQKFRAQIHLDHGDAASSAAEMNDN